MQSGRQSPPANIEVDIQMQPDSDTVSEASDTDTESESGSSATVVLRNLLCHVSDESDKNQSPSQFWILIEHIQLLHKSPSDREAVNINFVQWNAEYSNLNRPMLSWALLIDTRTLPTLPSVTTLLIDTFKGSLNLNSYRRASDQPGPVWWPLSILLKSIGSMCRSGLQKRAQDIISSFASVPSFDLSVRLRAFGNRWHTPLMFALEETLGEIEQLIAPEERPSASASSPTDSLSDHDSAVADDPAPPPSVASPAILLSTEESITALQQLSLFIIRTFAAHPTCNINDVISAFGEPVTLYRHCLSMFESWPAEQYEFALTVLENIIYCGDTSHEQIAILPTLATGSCPPELLRFVLFHAAPRTFLDKELLQTAITAVFQDEAFDSDDAAPVDIVVDTEVPPSADSPATETDRFAVGELERYPSLLSLRTLLEQGLARGLDVSALRMDGYHVIDSMAQHSNAKPSTVRAVKALIGVSVNQFLRHARAARYNLSSIFPEDIATLIIGYSHSTNADELRRMPVPKAPSVAAPSSSCILL